MKKRRYQEGGEAEGISGTAGRMRGDKKPRTTDDMTFGQAFRAARKAGKSTFMWRGDKFNTELEKPAAKPSDLKEVEVSSKRREMPKASAAKEPSAPKKKKTFLGALASRFGTAGQRKRGAEEGYKPGDITKSLKAGLGTQRTREELADEYEGAQIAPTALMGIAGGAAGMGGRAALRYGARKLAERGTARKTSDAAAERAARGASRRNMPSYSDRYRAGETAASRRAEFRQRRRDEAERRLDERLASDMEGGFKRGGGVKKYNKGGKIDGIAKRGKTRCRII